MKKFFIVVMALVLATSFSSCKKDKTINETINGFDIQWSKDFTSKADKDIVRSMINNMVYVEAGSFFMGDSLEGSLDNEKPVHKVILTDGFYINKMEVTQALWKAVMNTKSGEDSSDDWEKKYGLGDNYPAYRVSFSDAEKFIEKLNSITGLTFQLPTEAQWEYAARGGKSTTYKKFAGSNNSSDVAWTNTNATKCTEVGKLNPNELGLYDMSGNVWEMTRDYFSEYTELDATDPECTIYGDGYKVFRGGSWNNHASYARVTARYPQSIHYQDYQTGFRLSIKR